MKLIPVFATVGGSTLTGLDWVAIAIYFGILACVAWWVIKRRKDMRLARTIERACRGDRVSGERPCPGRIFQPGAGGVHRQRRGLRIAIEQDALRQRAVAADRVESNAGSGRSHIEESLAVGSDQQRWRRSHCTNCWRWL